MDDKILEKLQKLTKAIARKAGPNRDTTVELAAAIFMVFSMKELQGKEVHLDTLKVISKKIAKLADVDAEKVLHGLVHAYWPKIRFTHGRTDDVRGTRTGRPV